MKDTDIRSPFQNSMILIGWLPNKTSFSHFDMTQNLFLSLPKKKKKERESIKQQNKTETVIQFKLSVNLVVFWSLGETRTETFRHPRPSLAFLARACCPEVKGNGKLSLRKKRSHSLLQRGPQGNTWVCSGPGSKSKNPRQVLLQMCSQGNVPGFCKIQVTGITLYLNGSPDLANITGYTWHQTASRWQEMGWNSPHKTTEWISHLFIDLLT